MRIPIRSPIRAGLARPVKLRWDETLLEPLHFITATFGFDRENE
ncbi:MAG: hypothetical protein ACXW2G_08660 [Burkholderiaceae bacterium]